jgi:hypothetical protein
VSWGRNKGFRDEFEHTATNDPTSYLAAPEGIAFLREWDFDACVTYMNNLAWEAAGILTERWRTAFEIPREMVGTMVTVPLPQDTGTTDADATRLRLALLPRGAHRSSAPRLAWPALDESLGADLQRSIGHRTTRRRGGAQKLGVVALATIVSTCPNGRPPPRSCCARSPTATTGSSSAARSYRS